MSDARKYPGFSIITVCVCEALPSLTCAGWVVLDVLEEGKLQSQLTTLPIKVVGQIHDQQDYNRMYPQEYVERVTVELPCAMTHHLFVVGLDETAAHAYLERERATALKELETKTSENQALLKERDEALKLYQEQQTRNTSLVDTTRRYQDEIAEIGRVKRLLEEDIGKLRKAVGEMQFRDITWRCDCSHPRTQHNVDGCMINECRCRKTPE